MRKCAYKAPSLHPNARDTLKTGPAGTAQSSSSRRKRRREDDDGDYKGGNETGKEKEKDEEDVMRLPDSSSSSSSDDSEIDDHEGTAPEPVTNTAYNKSSKKRKLDKKERLPHPAATARTTRRQTQKSNAYKKNNKLRDTKPELPHYSSSITTVVGNEDWSLLLPPSLSSSQRESQKLKRVYTSSMRKKGEEERKEQFKTFKPDIDIAGWDGDDDKQKREFQIKKLSPRLSPSASPVDHSSQSRPQLISLRGKQLIQEEEEKKQLKEQEEQPQFRTFSAAMTGSFSPPASTTMSSFSHPDTHPSKKGRTLSLSSSSSLSSLSSLDENRETKKKKGTGEDEAAVAVECPVCHQAINDQMASFILQQVELEQQQQQGEETKRNNNNKRLKSLSLKIQRDICHKHRLAEAEDVCKERGFPATCIDWESITNVRIPKMITHLRQVLQRKTSSFYLQQLDTQAQLAKTKPKLLRTYLHAGVLDVVKPGYYGPKGQKVVADVVTTALASDLKKAASHDHVVRGTGIGAYVTAVLVPECTLRLVMEDIKTKSQEWARNVLAESSDIGQLLNPDIDRVEVLHGEQEQGP